MTRQSINNPLPCGEMTPKSKSVFNKLENSAKRALRPSTKDDYGVVNAIAAVHVENSRILIGARRFVPDGPIIDAPREVLGYGDSQGCSKDSLASPGDQGPNNLASRDAPEQSDSPLPTATPSEETENINSSLTTGSASPNYAAQQALPSTRQGTFSQNVPKPVFRVVLPKVGDSFTSTLQLATARTSGNNVQKSVLVLDEAEESWKSNVEKDSAEQVYVRWLTTRVAMKFLNCLYKDVESIAEVVVLDSAFEPEIYHRVVSSLVGQLGSEGLLVPDLLQGLMQLIQEALPGSLIDDDLVRILRVLREQLTKTYKALGDAEHAASKHIYQLSTIICRVLDAMMVGNIRALNRTEDHKPLLDLLVELKRSPDPYLKFQASYAWQALQYAGDDEPPLHTVLRIGGGVTMAALSVVSVFKFDPENLFKGLDKLAQAAGQAFDVVKAGVEGAQALRKGGEGVMDSLLKGFRSGSKRAWYPALLAARMCVRDGQVADFQQIIYEAPCRHESEFQWGVCQLLGEIAMDPIWAIENRQQAVDLLGKLYRSDKERITDPGAKQVILGILQYNSTKSAPIIQEHARILLQDLTTTSTNSLLREYPLAVRMSLPAASSLLDKALKELPLKYKIHRMMTQCRNEYKQAIYIPPQAKANFQAADEQSFSLMDKIKEYLSSNREVFLILGNSGAGKSTFNTHLWYALLKDFKEGDRIPLHITLPAIRSPETELISEHLTTHNFSKDDIQDLKRDRQFVIICDGYDEAQLKINLCRTNSFNQPGEWNVKMIISCRTTYLGQDFRRLFQPQPIDRHIPATPHLFQEAVIVPFSSHLIEDYIKQFVQETEAHKPVDSRSVWSSERYMNILKTIPNLMELVKNPFLLTLSLEALPDVAKNSPNFTKLKLTRLDIYDAFIDNWANNSLRRLTDMPLKGEEEKVLDGLIEDGFSQAVIDFLKDLAASIFQEQDGYPSVDYTQRRHGDSWKKRFFGVDPEPTFLRQSSPLARVGIQYSFIHHSLLEYFYSRHIYETSKINSVSDVAQDLADHPLGQRILVKEPSITQFLAEYVQGDPAFKQQLHQIIELSKTDKEASQAAANAMTILVRAGVHFNGADLKDVQIPGADLSGGQFDSAQLQGSDLRTVNLRNVWLRQADLSNAQMTGVQFGEWPFLEENSSVNSCAYSQDGEAFAVGLLDGTISLYNTATWEKKRTLSGHTSSVTSVVFSPSGQRVASGSYDDTVRLWDAQTGAPGAILSGHTSSIRSVVFSPSGQHIASGSYDETVRLWDVKSGRRLAVVEDFHGTIAGIAWIASENGSYFVTGCYDKTVRLWQVIGDQHLVCLHWSSMHDRLVVSNTNILNAQSLSRINMKLLEQRARCGQPDFVGSDLGDD
ncbi:WD_REPEATS_REGION domain-containing protein [Haplosporangium gracile]|nr:WD_REPEATS_REGION domain-containing protein [Haplosporangium gracile]